MLGLFEFGYAPQFFPFTMYYKLKFYAQLYILLKIDT
jgi:hypothetical protein